MGEYLPDGRYQRHYGAICEGCGAAMPVNLYGMGTCPACGRERDPFREQEPKKKD